jgi:hypothetical protein
LRRLTAISKLSYRRLSISFPDGRNAQASLSQWNPGLRSSGAGEQFREGR